MNYKHIKSLLGGFIICTTITTMVVSCNEPDPIYADTLEVRHNGSFYYATSEANCKNCHGTEWKGDGPDARNLNPKPTDFTVALDPNKTSLDYFKAITVGTDKTKSMPSAHAYQSLTDRSRWAMANFLYSLGKPSKNEAQRKKAIIAANKEMQSEYAKSRRWYMGANTPSSDRSTSEAIDKMLDKASFTPTSEISLIEVSPARKETTFSAQKNQPEGYQLYRSNCQSCHGVFGEGAQGAVHLSSLDGQGEGVGGFPRRKPVGASIRDFTEVGNLSVAALQAAHLNTEAFGQRSPSLSDDQWNEMANYIKSITGKAQ
ncbi:MAG: c-type cytochrome [Leptonema sp. (in: Bacteria)]|nr:c-type cytochrome [Leptonema sp. (in: bacteria)]